MKHLTIIAAATLALLGCRPNEMVLTAADTEVVIDANAPRCVTFAAGEMTNFLARAFGAHVPIVRTFTPGKKAIVLGDNAWSHAAGIDAAAFERDEFAIKAEGDRVYITGKDDPKSDPGWAAFVGGYPRVEASTLFGVYEFLERHVGCRFYFPGEMGEIVPSVARVTVPHGMLRKKPLFSVRYVYLSGDGEGFLTGTNRWGRYAEKALNWMRLRMETKGTPCCHGINSFKYPERFGATHPEWFQMRKDGTRCTNLTYNGSTHDYRIRHLCYSSAITNQIFEDVKARLLKGARYVDVMPQDGSAPCECPLCKPKYRTDGVPSPATEHIWGWCRDLANRLIDEKIPGNITMMAYSPYRRVPDFNIPTNVLVMVAERGPWEKVDPVAFKRANGEVRAWAKKMNRTVWVWTYPHKYQQSAIPCIPQMTPRAWGEYYNGLKDVIFGSFAETESDRWIYNYLNYYVFSRVAWDPNFNLDAVLDEHYRLMFGAAAEDMKSFYELLEKTWLTGIQGHVEDTPLGPVTRVPPPLTIWREIYSPKMLAQCAACFAAAERKLASGSPEAKRLAFIKQQFFVPLKNAAESYLDALSVEKERAARARRNVINLVNRPPDKVYPARIKPDAQGVWTFDCDYSCTTWNLNLEPETEYRVSYFLKLENMYRRKDWKGTAGGAMVEVHDGATSTRHPYPIYEDGSFDWIHRQFTFKTPKKEKMKAQPYVMPRVLHATGTARFSGLLVEKVSP